MNLVKKLPIGLGLACLMFMSSCSKEDAVTPGAAVTNESSNLRQGGPVISSVFHFPSTDGPTCVGCEPNNWQFKTPERDATSSLIAFAGNPLKKWIQPLQVPLTGTGSIITVVNDEKYAGEAFAVGKNLIPGKKYKLTISVSTTSLTDANGPSPYASKATIAVTGFNGIIGEKIIDLMGKKNQWITETIEFQATDNEFYFRVTGQSPKGETKLTYTNLHVGPNAVQQIN